VGAGRNIDEIVKQICIRVDNNCYNPLAAAQYDSRVGNCRKTLIRELNGDRHGLFRLLLYLGIPFPQGRAGFSPPHSDFPGIRSD